MEGRQAMKHWETLCSIRILRVELSGFLYWIMRDIRRALVQLQFLSWAGSFFITASGEFYQWPWIQRIRGGGYIPTLYYCILKQNFYKIPHHVLSYFIKMSYRASSICRTCSSYIHFYLSCTVPNIVIVTSSVFPPLFHEQVKRAVQVRLKDGVK